MWIHHLFSFIGTVLQVFVDLIGTTLLGLFVGIGFALATVLAAMLRIRRNHGVQAMVKHWNDDVKTALRVSGVCALVIYGPILLWSIGRAMYVDHGGLVQWSREQRTVISADAGLLQNVSDAYKVQIGQLQTQCAKLQGNNESLGAQNRDQQNTINNCQTEAIKLLAPQELKITQHLLNSAEPFDTKEEVSRSQTYLILTNKAISPISAIFSCDQPVKWGPVEIVGGGPVLGGGGSGGIIHPMYRYYQTIHFSSPAWTPTEPMIVELTYSSKTRVKCVFQQL